MFSPQEVRLKNLHPSILDDIIHVCRTNESGLVCSQGRKVAMRFERLKRGYREQDVKEQDIDAQNEELF